MNPRLLLKLLPVVVLTAVLSACVNLKPVADPTRFYVLSVEPAKQPLAEAAKLSLPVSVAAVETPAYLDDRRVAVRKQDNELSYDEFHQWAEPVRDGLTRCLREHLGAWLGAGRVNPLGRRWPAGDYLQVQARISRFERTQAGQAVLTVHWRVVQVKTGAILYAQQTELTREIPNASTDAGAGVRALSDAIAAWSREVAEAVSNRASGAMPAESATGRAK